MRQGYAVGGGLVLVGHCGHELEGDFRVSKMNHCLIKRLFLRSVLTEHGPWVFGQAVDTDWPCKVLTVSATQGRVRSAKNIQ